MHPLTRTPDGADMVRKFAKAFPDDPLAREAVHNAKAAGHS